MIDSLVNLLGFSAHDPLFWMPLVFMAVLFAVITAGALLDGFDIGVGCLLLLAPTASRTRMMALLGPWRDANAYWLFLGLGLFVSVFPKAWGDIMEPLYLPLTLMALGVFIRLVSFELRLRAPVEWQSPWIKGFAIGSLMTAFAHGLLLAQLIVGAGRQTGDLLFTAFIGACVLAAYALLGATWLIMREAGHLRIRALMWGRHAVRWVAAGAVAVSIVLALSNTGVFLRWSDGPPTVVVVAIWVALFVCFMSIEISLRRMVNTSVRTTALPFLMTWLVFVLILGGIAYSFFPYLVLDNITIWDAAASVDAMRLVLAGAIVALPVAFIFNLWVYWTMLGPTRPPQPPPYAPGQA